MFRFVDFPGQGGLQLIELTLAFVLSALVGLEREFRQKSAGLRTHTLVGVSAALIMLISKYGFMDILANNRIVLDPSRVAAQVVSGIGFIGGGVIFMRRDVVRGLTTAASIWFTAALGMACGAGLVILAVASTIGHFVIMIGFRAVARRVARVQRAAADIFICYEDGRGLLRDILVRCSDLRFAIDRVRLDRVENGEEARDRADDEGVEPERPAGRRVALRLQVTGKRPVSELISVLGQIDGVSEVGTVGADLEVD